MAQKLMKILGMQGNSAFSVRGAVLFLVLWITIGSSIFAILSVAGFAPAGVKDFLQGAMVAAQIIEPEKPLPLFSKDNATLVIDKVGIKTPIVFSNSKDKGELKRELDTGVVHYVDSALPGEKGNAFIFGHSSSKVFESNPYRTVFTRLPELRYGDKIVMRSGNVEYRYRVTLVEILKPQEAKVYLSSPYPKLTLSTCWPVGDPANRFIVEAEFIGKSLINES